MWLNRTADPAGTPISLVEAKAHLRVLHAHDDDYITALIEAATQHLDGRNGLLGRSLVTQSWEYRICAFPGCGVIRMPFPPLQSVEGITYVDGEGTQQTLDPALYVVDASTFEGQVRRAFGVSWPETRWEEHAVRIAFTAGYGAADAVPTPIRHAIRLMIGHWYLQREAVSDTPMSEVPMAACSLLGSYRVQTF